MEGSSIDESTTTDSTSTTLPTTTSPVILSLSSAIKSPLHHSLCRLGSGTSSVILDLENNNNNIEAESRKLPSSRFKGVVPQPNGRWGAQIYEKHQRVWLGTFNEEEEAGKAYDVAAQRFRGRDAITNFKPLAGATEEDEIESAFLNRHSKAEIVDMLRKHTYNDELSQSKKHRINHRLDSDVASSSRKDGSGFGDFSASGGEIWKAKEQLFEKTVTPSDVGKLNRLVIPKQHAEKHFPLQSGSCSKGVLLNFEDTGRRVWRFRYSYWNSSQSYVLTKGWSRFVKEKCLKAGDVVCFQRSTGPPDNNKNQQQLYIDFKARSTGSGPAIEPVSILPVQMVRLFGVNIVKPPVCGVVDSTISSRKRIREVEMLSLEICSKKQRVIGAS